MSRPISPAPSPTAPSFPRLTTARLLLRRFEESDVEATFRLAGDRAVADTTLSIPHPYTIDMARGWIASHQKAFADGSGLTFAIVRRPDRKLVGAIGLADIAESHKAELGYWIGCPYWNNGYCSEAASAVLDYAFGQRKLIRVHARHFVRNPASGRVLQKIGMRREGSLRQHVMRWGKPEDLETYGILRQEWTPSPHRDS